MVDFLNTTIEVPVWYPVIVGLVGVVIGLLIVLLATWVSSRGRTRVTKPEDNKRKQVAVAHIVLSAEQRLDLANRSKVGGGYLIRDLIPFLGVTERDVMRWIQERRLSTFRDFSKQLWVTAVSVASLVDKLDGVEGISISGPPLSSLPPAQPLVVETVAVSRKGPPPRQHYWYTVDGSDGRYATLKEALKVAGCPLADGANPDWKKVPATIKGKIHREKV
jgi:hypothetical protein